MKIFVRTSLLILSLAVAGAGTVACGSDDASNASTTGGGTTTTTGAGGGGTTSTTGAGGAGGGGTTSTTGTGGAGTGGSGTGGSGGAAASQTSQGIVAADGGTVTFQGITIEIPPDALVQDTTITVAVGDAKGEPDEASILSKVYDLGPDGTQFSKFVTLSIDFDPSLIPQGKTAGIAWLDGAKWTPLADSKIEGNKVVAPTSHFTKFAIVVMGDPGVGCAGLPFAACGGDPVGTWTISDACFQVTKNPYEQYCPGSTFVLGLDMSGSITLSANGDYAEDITTTSSMEIRIPVACAIIQNGDCSQLDDNNPFVLEGNECVQKSVDGPKQSTASGTWATNGNVLTITDANSSVDLDYCVSGNDLLVQGQASGGLEGYYTYKLTK